ncbi:MAG: hypothetical protein GX631_04620 [Dehalococcoidales bacterium]|nr:hypothetical protein [Dehalococcoidales bacterium]
MSQQPDDPKKNKNLTGLAIPGASVIGLGIDFYWIPCRQDCLSGWDAAFC